MRRNNEEFEFEDNYEDGIMIRLGVWNEKKCLMKFLKTHASRITVASICPVVNIDDPTAEDPDRIYMLFSLDPPVPIEELPVVDETPSPDTLIAVAGYTIIRGGK